MITCTWVRGRGVREEGDGKADCQGDKNGEERPENQTPYQPEPVFSFHLGLVEFDKNTKTEKYKKYKNTKEQKYKNTKIQKYKNTKIQKYKNTKI